jgi:cytoskeletal protein RodZ
VGETLQLARERKGVDLYRAERDTKIRLKYLSALEDGDYDELPAPVYVKGFLRNYAIYLGLEPDEILERWRDEMEQMRTATRVAVIPPPMPLVEPGGRRLHITPSMVVAGLVLLVVFAFIGYIGVQLMRFVETTPVGLTNPPNVFSQIDADAITLAGTSGPGASIRITGPGDLLYNVSADENGVWSREVPLARGRNDFTVVATDPVTQRESKPLNLTINVPLPSPSPTIPGSSPTAPPLLLTLSLTSPPDGFQTSDGSVLVQGTTSGTRVTMSSTWLDQPGSTPAPVASPSPAPTSPTPTGSPPPIGPARDINVLTGTFAETLEFPVGRWQLTVVAYATGQTPVARQVTLNVGPPAPVTHQLIVAIEGQETYVKVLADGAEVHNGRIPGGESRTFTAFNQFCVRTGNAGAIHLTFDAQDLGLLGAPGKSGSWVVTPGLPPVKVPQPC